MKICERCGTEYETDQETCTNCPGELTPLEDLESYESYREIRDRADDGSHEGISDRRHEGSVLLVPLLTAAGALASVRLSVSSVLAYGAAVVVAGYGLAGLFAGFWIGGPLVIVSGVVLTPPVRRRLGSTLLAVGVFVVLFVIGRASPTAWLV